MYVCTYLLLKSERIHADFCTNDLCKTCTNDLNYHSCKYFFPFSLSSLFCRYRNADEDAIVPNNSRPSKIRTQIHLFKTRSQLRPNTESWKWIVASRGDVRLRRHRDLYQGLSCPARRRTALDRRIKFLHSYKDRSTLNHLSGFLDTWSITDIYLGIEGYHGCRFGDATLP